MDFIFDQRKNQKLFQQRGVTFEQAIESIAKNGVLLDFQHPNSEDYPNQRIMVIAIDGEKFVLKTLFPDRRFKYLLEGENNE